MARSLAGNRTNGLLVWMKLKLDRSCSWFPLRTTALESDEVKWALEINKWCGNWYLKIERGGEKGAGEPLYCVIDIRGPDFGYYFEYYFKVGTYYILLIPEIRFDEEDPPVNITCEVSKRRDHSQYRFRADSFNGCYEKVQWDFPELLPANRTWSTGFCLVIESSNSRLSYAFEVVLHQSGILYFQTQREVPGDVHFWGSFHGQTNFDFSVVLKRGDLRVYVCDVELPWFPLKIARHTLGGSLYVKGDISAPLC